MKKLEDILNHTEERGVNRWTLNTTKSNLIGFERSDGLSKEIANWEIHKHFVNKYGLMFNYPEDFISIYLLISLLKNFRILCHPDEQKSNSTLDKLKLPYNEVRWLYDEEIHYNREYDYYVESNSFYKLAFHDFTDNRGLFKSVWDLATKSNPKSRMYELSNSHQIHQAVICGGNGDVDKCPNYYGINSDEQKKLIIDILSNESEPNLNQLLNNSEFFIADYKGEDIEYARQLHFYTVKDEINRVFKNIIVNFNYFQSDLKEIAMNSKNLNEYFKKLNEIEIKYGC